MNWRELLRNKKLLAGMGAAAAVGLFVLWRRGGLAGGKDAGADVGDGGEGAGVRGGVGYFDSTGTDVANWLGNYSGALQGQLDDFRKQMEDSWQDALGNMPTAPVQPPPPAPLVKPTKLASRPDLLQRYLTMPRVDPRIKNPELR